MPNKGYVLSTRDRSILKDLIRKWDRGEYGRRGINPNEQQQTKPIWARVKTGTRITALRQVGGTLTPGEGEVVLWRNGWKLNAGNAEPVLTKINSQGSVEGQDPANEADDETVTVYNYTPYEVFDFSWVQVTLSRQGRWELSSPPLPVYFARNQTDAIDAGEVGSFQLGHLDLQEIATGNTPAIQWVTGQVVNVYCALNSVGPNEIVIVAQEPGGKFVVVEQSDSSNGPERVRYALNVAFSNTGQTTASVLDVLSGNSVVIGDIITVYDVKKQFGDTLVNSVGIASKFRIGDGSGSPENEVWQVETTDQVFNKVKGNIGTSLQGNDPTETVQVTITNAESYWPYVLDDGSGDNAVTATNLNMFTANAGVVYLERRINNSLLDDESNETAPYSHTGGAPKWIITEVEKPTARWVMCQWNGTNWALSLADGFWEGYSPSAHDTLNTAVPDDFINTPCELQDLQKGIAFLSNRGLGGAGPKYIVISTMSALYGEGKKVDLVADLALQPMTSNHIVYQDGCDIKYRKVTKAIVFGNTSGEPCLLQATDETAPPLNIDEVDVITSVAAVVDGITGEIKLEITKSSIKTCQETPLADVDVSILTPVTSNVLTDIACVGQEITQSYETIKHLGTTTSGSNTVDLSCIVHDIDWTSVYIDYSNIINYPDVYVDYYHILWPDGCEPCDPPPPEGCCTITYDSGSTEDRTSSQAWCTSKGTESGVSTTSWAPGGPCGGGDPTGCCTDQLGGFPDSMLTAAQCAAAGGSWAGAGVACTGCDGDVITLFEIVAAASSGGGCTAEFQQGASVTMSGGSATINGTWSGVTNFMTPYSLSGSVTLTHDGTNWNFTGTNPADGSVFSGSCTAPCGSGCGGQANGTAGSICSGWQNGNFSFTAS